MRLHRTGVACAAVMFLAQALAADRTLGAVSYLTPGSTYTQDFTDLPDNTVSSGNIETTVGLPAGRVAYIDGWQDDVDASLTPENDLSLIGWYLFHPLSPAEGGNGFNDHQRIRFGTGASNTGSFYGFSTGGPTDDEKALGGVNSNTLSAVGESMFIALRLVNNTGVTLNEFSLNYNGEQWRDGVASPANPETLSFAYSTVVTPQSWTAGAGYTAVPELDFTAPVNAGDAGVNGNVAGRVNGIAKTVTGISWAPGTELWLRWRDVNVGGNDDGLAIDDLTFSAAIGTPGSSDITSVTSGPAEIGTTWSDGLPPGAGKNYSILSGHTVDVSSAFAGDNLRIRSGGVAQFSGSAFTLPSLIVDAGANVTETVSGDFELGNINAMGVMIANQDLTFNMDAGSDFSLNMNLFGGNALTFNSDGAGSDLWLSAAGGHQGTIRFNGTGDKVMITENQAFGTLEMNSTGENTLFYDPKAQLSSLGNIVFNQPGVIDHAATITSPQRRLQGSLTLTANAHVTVDLTKGFPNNGAPAEERRFFIQDSISGNGDITVNGMSFDPTSGVITHNEFELGSSGEPGTVPTETYSGTITANDYVDLEIRHNMPAAKFVIGSNARLEMGHQVVAATKTTTFGEIEVKNGGTLEVGFEQSDGTVNGHHAYRLTLDKDSGRSGGLTLESGSTLRMQINGTAANQFDAIEAEGNVTLGGTLNVLINPAASMGTNPTYTAAANDTFDILKTVGSSLPAGDYNGNGSVGNEDYDVWKAAFGTVSAAADGNGNGTVDAADYVVWRNNFGATGAPGGTINGTFSNVVVSDPGNALSGFTLQVLYSSSLVQLKVVGPGSSSITTIPEPSALASAGIALMLLACRWRRNR